MAAVMLTIGNYYGSSRPTDLRDYDNSFWTDSAPTGGEIDYDNCGSATEDTKTEYYGGYTVGPYFTIMAHKKSSGVTMGAAVYPVKAAYQGCSLHQLIGGGGCNGQTTNIEFTEDKDSSLSYGSIRDSTLLGQSGYSSTWKSETGGGAQSSDDDEHGDMFIDHAHAIIGNAYSNGGTYWDTGGQADTTTKTRLTTTYARDIQMGPHAMGGIGGYHHRSSWQGWYESSPIYGYCYGYNLYGIRTFDVNYHSGSSPYKFTSQQGGGTSYNPWGNGGCFTGDGAFDIEFSLHISGAPVSG